MLAHLLKVDQRILHPLGYSGHSTQSGALELFALEQRLSILEQSYIITSCNFPLATSFRSTVYSYQKLTNCLNQLLRPRQLRQGYPKMVGIVEGVEKIAVERVDVLQFGEAVEDGLQFLGEGLGRVFNLSGIELRTH
jgi:hypothetical protein